MLVSLPENDSFRKDFCFTHDVFFFPREISEMRGPTGVKFCTMVRTRPNFIMPVQNFGGRTPKKFRGRKTCKIWPDFGRLRSSAANISETDEDIQIQDSHSVYGDSSCVRRNKYSEVWSSDLGDLDVKSYPPKVHFSEEHILAFRGCYAPKFLHALENNQVLLAPPPSGDGGPPYNFF